MRSLTFGIGFGCAEAEMCDMDICSIQNYDIRLISTPTTQTVTVLFLNSLRINILLIDLHNT